MILLAEHDEPALAAKKKRQHGALKKTATSTPKNRVWGFDGDSLGRPDPEPQLSWENAISSVQYSYENASGRANYYTADHLGSVRELCSSTGTIVARYSYDSYGRATLVSGTNLSDFQYAGMYTHQPSGLNLTKYRAYDPNTARWLSRDPLKNAERRQGPNLYEYVKDDPIDNIDPTGELTAGRIATIGATQVAGGGPEDIFIDIIDIGIILWPDSDSDSNCKKCPPCTPYPAGTIGYIGPHTDHDHYPIGRPHLNLFQVNQNKKTCKCFWNKATPDSAAPPPAPGWVDLNGGFPVLAP